MSQNLLGRFSYDGMDVWTIVLERCLCGPLFIGCRRMDTAVCMRIDGDLPVSVAHIPAKGTHLPRHEGIYAMWIMGYFAYLFKIW